MIKRNYAVVAIAMVSLMLAVAPTETEALLEGVIGLLNALLILVGQLLDRELTPVEQAIIGNCSKYNASAVTLAMLENKTWYLVKTNSSYTCLTLDFTPIVPGSLVPLPRLPVLDTDQARISYVNSGMDLTKFFTTTNLTPGRGQFLSKQFTTNLTSPDVVNQTLTALFFVVLYHSNTTMMAVLCPIQPTSTFHALHIFTSDGIIHPEVEEFQQQAANQGVDLHNFHTVDNSVCSFPR